jgi:hypothetical protein
MAEPVRKNADVRLAHVHVVDLATHLAVSSGWAARDAIVAYTEEQFNEKMRCALQIGAAAEWLIRAALAAHSPGLLADRRSHDSMLALSNIGANVAIDVTQIRTIATTEAVSLLLKIDPGLGIRADAEFVMDVRNSAAHLALVNPGSLEEAAKRLVRLVTALLPMADVSSETYWTAELIPLASKLFETSVGDLSARIESKLAAARNRLEQITRGLGHEEKEATLRLLESRPVRWTVAEEVEDRIHTCPACGRTAQLTYLRLRDEEGELVVDEQYRGEVDAFVLIQVTLIPTLLQCPVCGLILNALDDEFSGFHDIHELPADEPDIVAAGEYYASEDPGYD